jgi:hypothetical protein
MEKANSTLLGEELVGAELLASRELAEGAGSIWETLERGGKIQQQQLNLLCQDYTQYLRDLASADPLALPRATGQLLERRLTHVSEGWQEFGGLLQDEFGPIGRAWRNFFQVVRQDWRR